MLNRIDGQFVRRVHVPVPTSLRVGDVEIADGFAAHLVLDMIRRRQIVQANCSVACSVLLVSLSRSGDLFFAV
jgi:hypothetical protein